MIPIWKNKHLSDKYIIEKVQNFHILTVTDSTSLKFIFISDLFTSTIPESKYRDILFEVITTTDIYKKFDISHPFLEIFNARKEHKKRNWVTMKLKI